MPPRAGRAGRRTASRNCGTSGGDRQTETALPPADEVHTPSGLPGAQLQGGRCGPRCPLMYPPRSSLTFRFDDLSHGDAKLHIIDHHDFAAGDQAVVDIDIDRLAELAVKLDHGTAPELEQLADLHRRLAEHRADCNRNVVDGFEFLG